jgi:aminopeptidase N
MLVAIPTNANPVVAEGAIARWAAVHSLLSEPADQERVAAVVREKWLPRLQQLGFEPRDNESVADANLRAQLLGTLGAMEDKTVLEQAQRRLAALASDPRTIDGPLKSTWLRIAARNASAQEWDLLARLAAESTSTVERQTYYELLGSVQEAALAQRALDFALTGQAGTTSAAIIAAVAANHTDLAYDFALANREKVNALLDAAARSEYFADIAANARDPSMIAKLETLRRTVNEDERRPIDRTIGQLRQRFTDEPRMAQEITAWLGAR